MCAPSAALKYPGGFHFHNGILKPKFAPYFHHKSVDSVNALLSDGMKEKYYV